MHIVAVKDVVRYLDETLPKREDRTNVQADLYALVQDYLTVVQEFGSEEFLLGLIKEKEEAVNNLEGIIEDMESKIDVLEDTIKTLDDKLEELEE